MNQNNCKFRWIYYHWAYRWRDGTNPVTVERHWVNYSAETSHQKYRPTQYRKLKYTNIGLIPTQVHLILCYIFQTYSITVICQYVSKLCTNSKKYLLCLIMLHIFIITLYEVISLPNWWVDMGYFFFKTFDSQILYNTFRIIVRLIWPTHMTILRDMSPLAELYF